MPEEMDGFDDFLLRAFESGVGKPEYKADMAQPEEIPPELASSILAQVRGESSRILAGRIVAGGDRAGWSIEDLIYEAVDEEREARQFLSAGGDPRRLSPRSLARLIWAARLEQSRWGELLGQAVADYIVSRRPIHGEVLWGRTTGLTGDQRAEALLGDEVERDPIQVRRLADEFVEEVIDAWKILRRMAGGGLLPND